MSSPNIDDYSEEDTRAKLIDPKLKESGWDEEKIRREVNVTDGTLLDEKGARKPPKEADYVLFHGGLAIAIVEAKKASDDHLKGMKQAKDYSKMYDCPFAYSAIVEEDLTCGFSNHLTRLRVKKDLISPEWLVLILRFNWLSSLFLKKSRKWIGQAGMNEDNILDTDILIPDPDIQDAIIKDYRSSRKQFEEMDELISKFMDDFQTLRVSVLKYLVKNNA